MTLCDYAKSVSVPGANDWKKLASRSSERCCRILFGFSHPGQLKFVFIQFIQLTDTDRGEILFYRDFLIFSSF